MEQQLILYETEFGEAPFNDWLTNLKDRRIINGIRSRLNRVRQGNFGDCKYIYDGVLELRSHYGKGYRVYFGKYKNNYVVLLCGGTKSSPLQDIQQAIKYWDNFKLEILDE